MSYPPRTIPFFDAVQPHPVHVPSSGHKFIVSKEKTGGSDLLKLLLGTGYSTARVLFLDAGKTFSRLTTSQHLPNPSSRVTVQNDSLIFHQAATFGNQSSLRRILVTMPIYRDFITLRPTGQPYPIIDWNHGNEPLKAGLTVVDMMPAGGLTKAQTLFVLNMLLAYFDQQRFTRAHPSVLVIDQFWQAMLTMEGRSCLELLTYVLDTASRKNIEIWLMNTTKLYQLPGRIKEQFRLNALLARMDHLYLLEHHLLEPQTQLAAQYLFQLSETAYKLLQRGSSCSSAEASTNQDVFIRSGLGERGPFSIRRCCF